MPNLQKNVGMLERRVSLIYAPGLDLHACIYITLEKAVFKQGVDEWTSKVAQNVDEAQTLVDVGFEYICDFGSEGKLFRKRK